MKKNLLYAVIAVFASLFAACSQEELLSTESSNKQVRLTVNVPGATPNTRANMTVEGYTMRCIMEILDESGAKIGEQQTETVDAATGKATFTFEKPEGAAKYLFWADYLDSDNQSFYNTTKAGLTNITYSKNKNCKLFNNPAADAFCANVGDSDLGSSITLKRPFTRIAVKAADIAEWTGLTNIVPNMNAGAGYNVATGEATVPVTMSLNDKENETLTALTGEEYAFFCYVFPYSGVEKGSTITFNDGTKDNQKELSITADQMKGLNENVSVNLKPTEEPQPDNKITVEIEIDNSFTSGEGGNTGEGEGGNETPGGNDESETPTTPDKIKVGAYISAAGEVVTDASQAVAVVFAMADDKADNSTYPDSKKAKAYAVALKNATGRVAMGDLSSFSLEATSDDSESYSGFKFDAALKAKLGSVTTEQSALFNSYYTATLAAITGEKLSAWYIPSKAQLADALQCEQMKDVLADFPANGSGAFIGATSSVNSGLVLGVTYTKETQAISGTGNAIKSGTSAIILPVLTIFE